MHKRLMATILLTLVAGCTGKTDKNNSQSASADSSAAAAATSPGDWSIEKTTSGIDGDTVFATKMFPFPDRNTTFRVSVSCIQNTKTPGMSIESYVGDEKNPDRRSSFDTHVDLSTGEVVHAPKGRVKYGDEGPEDLSSVFVVDSNFGNKLDMQGIKAYNYGPDVNRKSSLRFPLVVEVTNGAGVFELDIASSAEVEQVLNPCASGMKADPIVQERQDIPAPTAQQDAATASTSVRNPGAIRDTFSKKYDAPAEDTTVAQPAPPEVK